MPLSLSYRLESIVRANVEIFLQGKVGKREWDYFHNSLSIDHLHHLTTQNSPRDRVMGEVLD
jgi:hypothetical protein